MSGYERSEIARLGRALERLGKAMRKPASRLSTVARLASEAGLVVTIELVPRRTGGKP